MKTDTSCKCGGNNSLRPVIGGVACECGGRLELAQILQRIISRLNECDEQNSEMIQALVAADMGQCGNCDKWFKESELLRANDRATCDRCFHWEYFLRETDDDESMELVLPSLIKQCIAGKYSPYRRKRYLDLLPHEKDGTLSEPFLTEYRKQTDPYHDECEVTKSTP